MLGARPVLALVHGTGLWAFRLVLITLALTPARWLLDWPGSSVLRRMLGVSAALLRVAPPCLVLRPAELSPAARLLRDRPPVLPNHRLLHLDHADRTGGHFDGRHHAGDGPELEAPAPLDLPGRGTRFAAFFSAVQGRRVPSGSDGWAAGMANCLEAAARRLARQSLGSPRPRRPSDTGDGWHRGRLVRPDDRHQRAARVPGQFPGDQFPALAPLALCRRFKPCRPWHSSRQDGLAKLFPQTR